jgi:hypothetical protein
MVWIAKFKLSSNQIIAISVAWQQDGIEKHLLKG